MRVHNIYIYNFDLLTYHTSNTYLISCINVKHVKKNIKIFTEVVYLGSVRLLHGWCCRPHTNLHQDFFGDGLVLSLQTISKLNMADEKSYLFSNMTKLHSQPVHVPCLHAWALPSVALVDQQRCCTDLFHAFPER